MIKIVDMEAKQADLVSSFLCRSIRELCFLDHKNDADVIEKWISNKSPEHILKWLESSGTYLFLATLNDVPVGVSSFGANGEIFLNYVSPDYRFQGISKKLLDAMEDCLEQLGIESANLYSTATALRFYKAAGWIEQGVPDVVFGITGYPMVKTISS